MKPHINIEQIVAGYFRSCPPHQSDQKVAYIVLYDNEYFYFDQHDRIQLTTNSGRPSSFANVSTSLPSRSKWMNLERRTCYLHAEGNHHNIRSSSSTNLHQYLHCTSAASATSGLSSKNLQVRTFLTRSTSLRSATHICLIRHQSMDLSKATLTTSSTSATTTPSGQKHIATSRPFSPTCCMS